MGDRLRALLADPRVARTVRVLGVVTSLGWAVFATALAGLVFGAELGWAELTAGAVAALVLCALATPFVVGSTAIEVTLTAEPARVQVGGTAGGVVRIRRDRRSWAPAARVEVAVGAAVRGFDVSSARPEETFPIPTARRGVITVGPVSVVRGDPLGLLRRAVRRSDTIEVFVHPRTVTVDGLGAGMLRDLEGQPTNDLSDNDVAFHALRPYESGDDRRHVHWRTVARTGTWMVRQFVDTRTTRLVVVVGAMAAEWSTEDDFETGISVAGSVALRCVRDELGVTLVAGGRTVAGGTSPRVLDGLSRVGYDAPGTDLRSLAGRAARVVPDASAAILVTGAATPLTTIRSAAGRFGADVRILAIRIDPAATMSVRRVGQLSLLTVSALSDLSRTLRAVNQA